MPRYKLIIEYNGTQFIGWQRQASGLSIQGLIEEAIFKFSQETVNLIGSGRTDAGVHALGQVAHFDLIKVFSPYTVVRAINHYLTPYLIAIQDCEIVNDKFHARFSAQRRHYMYRIINRTGKIIIDLDKAWQIREMLDLKEMELVARFFLGTHDFTSFRTVHCQAKSPIKTIDQIKFEQTGQEIRIFFTAPSFLHHMVRNITSAIIYVGLGKLQASDVQRILQAKDRGKAPPTAPACGLYFTHVEY